MDKFLLVSEIGHLLLSLLLGLFMTVVYRNYRLLIISILTGFLLDIDHLYDYWHYFGLDFNLKRFLDVDQYMLPAGKIIVFFHGWEYLLILFLLGRWLTHRWKIKGLTWALVLPYFGHMLIDNFSYTHHPLAYFLTYRIINRFSMLAISGTLK